MFLPLFKNSDLIEFALLKFIKSGNLPIDIKSFSRAGFVPGNPILFNLSFAAFFIAVIFTALGLSFLSALSNFVYFLFDALLKLVKSSAKVF